MTDYEHRILLNMGVKLHTVRIMVTKYIIIVIDYETAKLTKKFPKLERKKK
jgi:hypothetical protein